MHRKQGGRGRLASLPKFQIAPPPKLYTLIMNFIAPTTSLPPQGKISVLILAMIDILKFRTRFRQRNWGYRTACMGLLNPLRGGSRNSDHKIGKLHRIYH